MKPVARSLAERGVVPAVIFTGQHPNLDQGDFGLDRYSSINLREPGREDPHAHVGAVTKALLPLLILWVLVKLLPPWSPDEKSQHAIGD